MLLGLFVVFGSVGSATALITFNEVPLWTTDPLITDPDLLSDVQFFAGDPSVLNYTEVAGPPANQYLWSGVDDATGSSPGLYDTFIGAEAQGLPFGTVTVDILSEMWLPGSTTLWIAAVSGGSIVDTDSISVNHNTYVPLTVSWALGFDTVYMWDDLDTFDLGELFHIDNFEGTPIPEPATILLVGSGLAGLAAIRRRKKTS